uniref:MADF domain-containing protein n=1 Tax=Amphiprion percula TaxID=161767 RepID=A0A3P8U2X7_AMPPE
MEYKLIMAVSGFPSLYDTNSLTYRDLTMRSDAWRQVAEIVGVPESECRRKWKTLRDQHRRERQREKERRESGVGLFNYRPWRYSSILSFLNPFIDARAAGTNGWALDPQSSQIQVSEMVGCSTTTETRSDDDETYGFAVADATTSSSSSSDFIQRKRLSSTNYDAIRLKEAKIEANSGAAVTEDSVPTQQHANMKELFEMMMQSVTSLATTLAQSSSQSDQTMPLAQSSVLQPDPQTHRSPTSWAPSRLNQLKTEEQEAEVDELLVQTDDDEDCRPVSPRPTRTKRKSTDVLLEEFLRKMEAREAQRDRDVDQRDDVTLFLLSLAPAMRRLTAEKQSRVRTKMQQFLHEAEFGAASFQ